MLCFLIQHLNLQVVLDQVKFLKLYKIKTFDSYLLSLEKIFEAKSLRIILWKEI